MKQFIIRIINFALIAAILFAYQNHALAREEAVEKHDARVQQAKELKAKYVAMLQESQNNAQASGYKDGVYEGDGAGFGGNIHLKVTIKNGMIIKAEVTSADAEDPEYLSMAKSLLDEIVDSQSTDIDTVTGATFSSTGILEAASAALEEASQ